MDHKTYIRLVYTHSEGDGGNDHVHFLHQELVLIFGTGLGVQSCMVWSGLDAVYVEKFSQLLHFLPAETVDDS